MTSDSSPFGATFRRTILRWKKGFPSTEGPAWPELSPFRKESPMDVRAEGRRRNRAAPKEPPTPA